MSKITRVVVLVVGLMAMLAAMAGAASATTWSNSGDTAFSATSSGGSLTVGTNTLVCTGGTATGSAGTSFVGTTWPGVVPPSGGLTFQPCAAAGRNYVVTCNYSLDATGVITGGVSGRINITSPGCSAKIAGLDFCRITGSVLGNYTNPVAPSTAGVITTGTSSLTVANGANACPLGTGAGGLSTNVFRITLGVGGASPHLGPIITRNP